MTKHATVVYYSENNSNPDAFHVMNINGERIQGAFYDHDIRSIKCITIEDNSVIPKTFKTLFMESDIQNFLQKWKIDF